MQATRESVTIAEFQARRRAVGRRVRPSMIAMIVGFGVFYFCEGCSALMSVPQVWVCGLAFAAVAAAIIHITYVWKRDYRCPECEEPVKNPMSRGGDVPLNPLACPNCGARLR